MKIEIRFHELMSDHIMAVPSYHRSEFIEAESLEDPKIAEYLATKKDFYGNTFEPATEQEKNMFSFDFMSKAGAAKLEVVVDPEYTIL